MSISENLKLIIFFDGNCGLCHKFVCFALYNMNGEPFLFASQNSDLFLNMINRSSHLPRSIFVCRDKENQLLCKGEAIRLIFFRLKYPWKIIAYTLIFVPKCILNYAYDVVAKYRHSFLKKPDQSCPIVPPKWRKLFLN